MSDVFKLDEASGKKVFSSKKDKKPFSIEKDDGSVVDFFIFKMSSAAANSWRELAKKKMKKEGDNLDIDYKDYRESFIALCVCDANGRSVPMDEIRSWNDEIVGVIFEDAQIHNGFIDAPGKDDEKKD